LSIKYFFLSEPSQGTFSLKHLNRQPRSREFLPHIWTRTLYCLPRWSFYFPLLAKLRYLNFWEVSSPKDWVPFSILLLVKNSFPRNLHQKLKRPLGDNSLSPVDSRLDMQGVLRHVIQRVKQPSETMLGLSLLNLFQDFIFLLITVWIPQYMSRPDAFWGAYPPLGSMD
jgi:hypothetical protein